MDTSEFFDGQQLVVQRANGSKLQVNLAKIVEAERRCDEVEICNPGNAPELMSFFNRSIRETHQLSLMLLKEKQRADRTARSIRGRLMLDEIPGYLKEKGLTSARSAVGSADLREAFLDTNKEYQEALEKAEYLDAVYELINGKLQSFQRAFYAVKQLSTKYVPHDRMAFGEDRSEVSGEDTESTWKEVPNNDVRSKFRTTGY